MLDRMLCAICVSMFQNTLKEGDHHATFRHVVMAADLACKICKYLCRLRDRFCPSPASNVQKDSPIRFRYNEYAGRSPCISFQQEASWLEDGPPWKEIALHVSSPRVTPDWWPSLLEEVKNDVPMEPWRVRKDHFSRRTIPANTGDPEVLKLATEWLKLCKGDQERCKDMEKNQDGSYCPPRLLDIGNLQSKFCRLIVTQHDTSIDSVSYVALSHCWGENPSFLTLRSDNIEDLRREIQLDALPRNFVESILACRHLGFRYLWIDSLCILQKGPGSERDWQLHATEMDRIYANCTLNVAVTRAANAEQGVFTDRDADFLHTAFVYAPIATNFGKTIDRMSSSDTDTCSLVSDEQDLRDEACSTENQVASIGDTSVLVTVFATEYDYQSALWELPLQSRGWVFQERIMAPRTLHFGEDRIHWECSEGYRNEYLHKGLPDSGLTFTTNYERKFSLPITFSTSSMDPLSEEDLISLNYNWLDLVSDYSETCLKHPAKDKFVAITAIAKQLQRVLLDRYVAGFFSSELASSLLWQNNTFFGHFRDCTGGSWSSDDGWSEEIVLDLRRDSTYRAPSWSWASVDSLAHFHCAKWAIGGVKYWQESQRILASITNIKIELADHRNPYGQILWAEIIVDAPISNLKSLNGVAYPNRVYKKKSCHPEIYNPADQLVALHVFEENRLGDEGSVPYIYGLVLAPNGVGTYRRIGFYKCYGPPCSQYPASRFERATVKLV